MKNWGKFVLDLASICKEWEYGTTFMELWLSYWFIRERAISHESKIPK
jgi:hypothetical protein